VKLTTGRADNARIFSRTPDDTAFYMRDAPERYIVTRVPGLRMSCGELLANFFLWGALYAIGAALWIDIIRSGFISADLVGQIVGGVVK
jgi:hypothetical protein